MKIFQMIKVVQKIQMEIKRESQQKMKDRIKMYDNNMDDEELEELIKDPEVK
jgi:aspartate carbamoyltransferase regulatory subunit